MAKLGNMAIDGADPRLPASAEKDMDYGADYAPGTGRGTQYGPGTVRPQERRLHDRNVTFEEYYHYAQITRAEEEAMPKHGRETSILSLIFPSKSDGGVKQSTDHNLSNPTERAHVTDDEWANASRALRTATRGAIFYLITTDILGPFGLPYAFATMGWGPGIALYTIFAVLAGYSGYLLWDIFMGMDSYQYPIRSFGDLGYRLYGPWMRYIFNFLQAIQLLLNVGLIVISNGEALSQATKFKLCFIICCMIWALVGFFVGQIRTLQKFGWLANVAVWLNLICMFITMGAAAHSLPNYKGSAQSAGATIAGGALITPNSKGVYPPVQTSGGIPATGGFVPAVTGAMQAIFAYGGSMIFPEFMAEMKRPKDFLTAMWAAQAFIYFWYMFYGLYMYGYQGQYTINPTYLGVSAYGLQTAGNVFAMVSAVIAAALYGNIGVKVIYNNVFVELLRAPALTTRAGKLFWVALVPVYWGVAFVLAAGIPNFSGMTAVVAALCILQFTYTFPPLLSIAYWLKKYAMQEGEGFDPVTGRTTLHDSGFGRHRRGLSAHPKRAIISFLNILYFLGSMALAGLGAYAAIVTLQSAFKENRTTSFTCHSPLDG